MPTMAMEGDLGTKFSQGEDIEGGNFGQVIRLRGSFRTSDKIEGTICLYLVLTLSFMEIILFAIF